MACRFVGSAVMNIVLPSITCGSGHQPLDVPASKYTTSLSDQVGTSEAKGSNSPTLTFFLIVCAFLRSGAMMSSIISSPVDFERLSSQMVSHHEPFIAPKLQFEVVLHTHMILRIVHQPWGNGSVTSSGSSQPCCLAKAVKRRCEMTLEIM